jgi:hypothetical protein
MAKKATGKRRGRTPRTQPTELGLQGRGAGVVQFLDRKGILISIMDTAVWLWFHQPDAVSIHILACVAHYSLHLIGEDNGTGPNLNKHVRKEVLYHAYDAFRYPAKVAEIYEFVPVRNQELLADAINSFEGIYGFLTPWMETFWFYLEVLLELSVESPDALFDEGIQIDELSKLARNSRQEFFAKVEPIFVRRHKADARPEKKALLR